MRILFIHSRSSSPGRQARARAAGETADRPKAPAAAAGATKKPAGKK
jgi:hypothetical protein